MVNPPPRLNPLLSSPLTSSASSMDDHPPSSALLTGLPSPSPPPPHPPSVDNHPFLLALQRSLQPRPAAAPVPPAADGSGGGEGHGVLEYQANCILLHPQREDRGNANLPQKNCKSLKRNATLMQTNSEPLQRSGNLADNNREADQENHGRPVQESHGRLVQESLGKADQECQDIVCKDLQEKVGDYELKACSTSSNLTLTADGADHQLINLMQIQQKVANNFASCGRQRLQRHWMESGGNVCIPEIWGREQHLGEWVSYGIVEDALRPAGLMAARAALISGDLRRRNSKILSASSSASSPPPPDTRSSPSPSPSPRRPLITADVGAS